MVEQSTGNGRPNIGFVLAHEQFPAATLVDNAEHAERAGFSHVWASDHAQPWQDNQGHSMFPWLTLTLVGERTRDLRFGPGVLCPTYRHHPGQVAQAFASLALLSPGRVFLGLGTGEAVNELAATGSFGSYQERHDRLAEAIELIRALWTGQRITHRGRYYRTERFRLYDVPSGPIPIYVAASGPKSAYLAGRLGDGWIAQRRDFMNPGMRAAFAEGARAAGRDPGSMTCLVQQILVVGDEAEAEFCAGQWRFAGDKSPQLMYDPDPVAIQRRVERDVPSTSVLADWLVSEDPADHVQALQRIIDLGGVPFVHSGQVDQHRVIDFYRRSVLPALRT